MHQFTLTGAVRMRAILVATVMCGSPLLAADLPDFEAPSFGAQVVNVTQVKVALKAKGVDLPSRIGVLIVSVRGYSPAATAGLQPMDLINRVGRTLVRESADFGKLITAMKIGTAYQLSGYRRSVLRGKTTWKRFTAKVSPVSLRSARLSAMRKITDDISGTTTYMHRDSSLFVNSRTELLCYFTVTDKGQSVLRLRTQYVANDWLFMQKVLIKADDKAFTIDTSRFGEVERDNSGGKIWEWHTHDLQPDSDMLEAICSAKQVSLRYVGKQYAKDRELPQAEASRIQAVLRAYAVVVAAKIKTTPVPTVDAAIKKATD